MRNKTNPTEKNTADASAEASLRAQIETRAYHLWLAAGGRHGDDLKHWLQAESEILKAAIQDQSERSSAREASSRPKPHSSPAHYEEVSKK
jgi:hypothetical protein